MKEILPKQHDKKLLIAPEGIEMEEIINSGLTLVLLIAPEGIEIR